MNLERATLEQVTRMLEEMERLTVWELGVFYDWVMDGIGTDAQPYNMLQWMITRNAVKK